MTTTDYYYQALLEKWRLGEAAASISPKVRDSHPYFPWKQMIGMRNRLIHAYFDVDRDIIWKTASESIPLIIDPLENLILFLEKESLDS